MVMLFHFGWVTARNGLSQHIARSVFDFGWTGVDLFFVLSGFLITGILLDTRDAKNYFSAFYVRRVLRIFPLYYFSLLLISLLFLPYLNPKVSAFPRVVWYLVYAQNWTLQGLPRLGHFWSLAVEEQFYLVWPLLVWQFDRRRVLQIAVGGAAVALVLRIVLVVLRVEPTYIYHNIFTRMDALLIGAACACVVRDSSLSERLTRVSGWLWSLPLITLPALRAAVIFVGNKNKVEQSFGYTLIALSFAGLLLSLVLMTEKHSAIQTIFRGSILSTLGKYSYAGYVWHQLVATLVLRFERRLFHTTLPWFVNIPLLLASTFLVCLCSYAVIERPFLALKKYFEPQRAIVAAGSVDLLAGARGGMSA
jgi:peptidoglycan/LPS O-acetylase OafA/YrhL